MLEQFKARLIELSNQKNQVQAILNQALADIQTIDGAMMEIQRWISTLENQEKDGEEIEG